MASEKSDIIEVSGSSASSCWACDSCGVSDEDELPDTPLLAGLCLPEEERVECGNSLEEFSDWLVNRRCSSSFRCFFLEVRSLVIDF